jgi:hypothetical protein
MATPIDDLALRLAASYAELDDVEAVALAGSRGGELEGDEHSDLDLYVYRRGELAIADRRSIPSTGATELEIGNTFWEDGDEWVAPDPLVRVDVTFRHVVWIEDEIDRVLVRHEPRLGYSTCFLCSVQRCTILRDRTGWLGRLKARASGPYPSALRDAILAKNHPVLRAAHSAYLGQIATAAARGDLVSVNHRIAALLASYFDIVIAVNQKAHPGEKRLVEFVRERCASTPESFDEAVAAVTASPGHGEGSVLRALTRLLDGLDAWLSELGLLPSWPPAA